jgi:hypothetical protein
MENFECKWKIIPYKLKIIQYKWKIIQQNKLQNINGKFWIQMENYTMLYKLKIIQYKWKTIEYKWKKSKIGTSYMP